MLPVRGISTPGQPVTGLALLVCLPALLPAALAPAPVPVQPLADRDVPRENGPAAIHYPRMLMGRVATDHNHIAWDAVERGGRVYIRVAGVLYAGLASTPLCPSQRAGGTIRADVWNRTTHGWERDWFYQGDVSQGWDRAAQLAGGRLLELDWGAMHALGATLSQGWGRTPVKNIHVYCPR